MDRSRYPPHHGFAQRYVENVSRPLADLQSNINNLQRTYMQAQMDVMSSKKSFYPDANSTLRITYGKVCGYNPRDAIHYDFYTYLDGVMEKYVPGDYEFDVPARLIELYKKERLRALWGKWQDAGLLYCLQPYYGR